MPSVKPERRHPISDQRERHYRDRVRQHGQRYPEFYLPSVQVILDLIYTYDVSSTHLARRIAKYGLSLSAFNLLMILTRSGKEGCRLSEIGELLLVSRANITGLMDSLEEKALVERVTDSRDRRARVARITRAGEALLESLLPGHYVELRRICSALSNQEKSQLCELLTKLRHSIQSAVGNQRIAESVTEPKKSLHRTA